MKKYIIKLTALMIMILITVIITNAKQSKAADIYRNYIKDEKLSRTSSVELDSCGRMFQFSTDSAYVDLKKGIEKYTITRKYVDKKYKSKKVNASVKGTGCIEKPYIWSDEECDGTFYTYQNKKNSYLVYDDSRGNNVFKLHMKKLRAVFRENNINDGTVVNVERIKDKVVIVMVATVRPGDEESIKLAYACVVYDLKKGKITSSNLLDTFCREEDGYTLGNPQIDGKYIYFVESSGTCKRVDKNNVFDNRKRAVVVYNRLGKRIKKIDYTNCIKIFINYPTEYLDLEERIMCVKDGVIYVATRKGIYKCKGSDMAMKKVRDSDGTVLANINRQSFEMICINDKKLALIYTYDDDDRKFISVVK